MSQISCQCPPSPSQHAAPVLRQLAAGTGDSQML